MIDTLVNLISFYSSQIDEDVLVVDYRIENLADSLAQLRKLRDEDLIENELAEEGLIVGDSISLELSIATLSKFGIYINSIYFFNNYKYDLPEIPVFLYDEKCYIENAKFYQEYKTFVRLVKVLESTARYCYTKADDKYAFIGREDKYILVPLIFSINNIKALPKSKLDNLNQFLDVMIDSNMQEKRDIFLNELIDFLSNEEEGSRFITFINKIESFLSKAKAAFSFYLSDFKFNKLKLEIDSKLLEFNQKIQGVINDSQNKLIAIPAAFVLGLSSFDYEKIESVKNVVILCGLLIFTLLIQIFISNQNTALCFIKQNITFYKDTFGDNLAFSIKERFVVVDKEFKKQQMRLFIIEGLLWFVFISSIAFYLCKLLEEQYPSFLAIIFALVYSSMYWYRFYFDNKE
ncbi:hypothetical protein [Sphingobacterium sp.]|uniref:hypothetical protein n=1 Tax=Sphingobacterium sp. TaxID=341027 RepID=UPI002FDD7A06